MDQQLLATLGKPPQVLDVLSSQRYSKNELPRPFVRGLAIASLVIATGFSFTQPHTPQQRSLSRVACNGSPFERCGKIRNILPTVKQKVPRLELSPSGLGRDLVLIESSSLSV
jgi:hypothetical protein